MVLGNRPYWRRRICRNNLKVLFDVHSQNASLYLKNGRFEDFTRWEIFCVYDIIDGYDWGIFLNRSVKRLCHIFYDCPLRGLGSEWKIALCFLRPSPVFFFDLLSRSRTAMSPFGENSYVWIEFLIRTHKFLKFVHHMVDVLSEMVFNKN